MPHHFIFKINYCTNFLLVLVNNHHDIVDFYCLHSLLVVFNVCDMEFYARTVYVRVKTKSKSIIVRFFSIFNFNLGFFLQVLLKIIFVFYH